MTSSDLIGLSPQFQSLVEEVNLVAETDATVLIQGETGTGKEVVARAIHEASRRRNRAFVAVNCAAIPSALLESDLFGHERGAFTGAVVRKLGRFHTADGGTLFLDEAGDLPIELQPKLLRALQEQQFEPIGSNHPLRVDVRVIAATHQDLWQMVQDRRFRADLYYRLNVFPLAIPPLRERSADILLLAEYFVEKYAARLGKTITQISPCALETLKSYHWPGNVRELQNCIERSLIRAKGPVLELSPTELLREKDEPGPAVTLADAQRVHIVDALRKANWIIGGQRGAAAMLGIPRTTLIARMQKLGIQRPAGAGEGELDQPFHKRLNEFTAVKGVSVKSAAYG